VTPTATVVPAGLTIEVQPGETLFHAAGRQGYRWPTVCGGLGTCRTCFITVRDGMQNCGAMADLEKEGIQALGRPLDGRTRLACQLEVAGPIVVARRGVRRESEE